MNILRAFGNVVLGLALAGCTVRPALVADCPTVTVYAGTVTITDGWWVNTEEPAENPDAYLPVEEPPAEPIDPATAALFGRLDAGVKP